MNLSKIKKVYVLVGAVIVLLVVTNPSSTDFKNYISVQANNSYFRRTHNYFVCSTYVYNSNDNEYLGVIGNFFHIHEKPWVEPKMTKEQLDSAAYSTSSTDTVRAK